MKRLPVFSLLLVLWAFSVASAKELILSSKAKTRYVIILPKDALPSEKHAAKELSVFLNEIGGARFPVKEDTSSLPAAAILLGNNSHLSTLGVTPDWKALGKEGFLLLTKGEHLIIAGGRPRGTMYGVYGFLEEKLGCRWYTSKISKIPHLDRIVVPELNETETPALEYREPFNTDGFDANWAARNRCNSSSAALTAEHGGKIIYQPFVHSFFQLIQPGVYYKDHPEYFSLIGDQRTADNAQLCLTNPEVVKLMVEKVKEVIKAHPDVAIVSVSQNDSGGNCQCPKCKALDEAEGSPAGSLLTFVNAVAEEVEKEYPEVAIDTLAYQYTRKPPKTIKPRPNVIVRLCSIECDFGHPLATGERNKSFADDIRGWHKLCDRLYIWDYITSFSHYLVPFPNLHVLGPNIRFFSENGVKGIFEEGNYGPGGCGENNELRNFMLAKLLWNPKVEDDAVREDFLKGVYGPAAAYLKEYQRILQKVVADKNVAVPCWFNPDAAIFTDTIINRAEALFDKAEVAASGNKDLLLRVRQARMPIDYVVICRNTGKSQGTWKLTEKRFAPEVPKLVSAASERFFETAKAVGLRNLNEGGHGTTVPQVEEFHDNVGVGLTGVDVVWLKGERFSAALAPDLGCRILTLRDAKTGTDPLTSSQRSAQATNMAAYAETFFRNVGPNTKFLRNAQTGDYEADLPNGLRVSRGLTCLSDGLQITTRVTGKDKDQPLQATGRFLVALSGEVKLTGAFGEKVSPKLAQGATGNVTLTPAEVAGQPVTLKSAEGASVALAVQGPLAGVSVGPGPDGLLAVATTFEVPVLKAGETTEWKTTVTCSAESSGARAPASGVVECMGSDLPCYQEGVLSGHRYDPTASNGALSYIIGSTNEWALQWQYPVTLFEPDRKYDVLAVVRVVGNAGKVEGVGLTCGVYNTSNRVGKTGSDLTDDACKPGQWQTLKIGTITPESGDYIWFAPARNRTVKEIQLDRILMVPAQNG